MGQPLFLFTEVDDGGTNFGGVSLSATNFLTLVVTNVNDPPVMSPPANITVLEDSPGTNFNLKVIDVDTAYTNITVGASSSKTNLAAVSASRIGTNYYLTVTPVMNANSASLGNAIVTVWAFDGNLGVTNSMMLVVTAVNDPPTFSLATNTVYAKKYGADQYFTNFIAGVVCGPTSDETNQTWKATVIVDKPALFITQPQITTNGLLLFKSSTNSGIASVRIKITDNGGLLNGGLAESAMASFNIVVPDSPFASLAGEYVGLFYETNQVVHDRAGYVSVSLNRVGQFSGYQLLAGTSNRFAGQFDIPNGMAQCMISNANLQMSLALDMTNGTETIDGGIVSSGSWTSVVQAVRSVVGTDSLVPGIGDYTLVIPGNSGSPSVSPGGDGILWGHIADSGAISMTGSLADGTSISQKTGISKYGEWPLYVPLYTNGVNGLLLSWITFTGTNQYSAIVSNSAVWIKKAAAGGSYYGGGFTVSPVPQASVFYPWDGLWVTNATVVLGRRKPFQSNHEQGGCLV